MEKMEENIKNQKIKMIYKEKARRFHVHRKYESGNSVASAKSSSKTNSWSEEDQQVSQYLNFEEQELPEILKAQ